MTHQVLARKWRPRTFTELAGQEHVLRALVNALDNQRLHHAFLFTGTRGVGKTTIARILAKSLNCDTGVTSKPCGTCSACREIDEGRFVDLIEVDAASRTKVEDTRELLENVQYAPTRGRYKIYLIDEVHMLSNHSFNALLKTLEEPPPHVKFLLATTDPQRLPVTILSRCLQFNLKRLSRELIRDHVTGVLKAEKVATDAAAVALIARAADGSMRDALSLVDQAIAYGGGELREADVRTMLGTIDRSRVFQMLDGLAAADGAAILGCSAELAEQALDFADVLAELISVLHHIAVVQAVPDAAGDDWDDRDEIVRLAAVLPPEDVQLYYQIGLIGRRDLAMVPDARSGFEMALLRMLAFRPGDAAAVTPARHPGRTPAMTPVTASKPAVPTAPTAPPPAAVVTATRPVARAATGTDEWETIVSQLAVEGLVRELAANCVLKERRDDAIHLVLGASHVHLHNSKYEKRLEQALQQHYNTPLALRVEVGEQQRHTPMQLAAQRNRERQRDAEAAIDSDSNVQALREVFGAKIVPDSVYPVE